MKLVIKHYYTRGKLDVHVGPFASEELAQEYADELSKNPEDNFSGSTIVDLQLP